MRKKAVAAAAFISVLSFTPAVAQGFPSEGGNTRASPTGDPATACASVFLVVAAAVRNSDPGQAQALSDQSGAAQRRYLTLHPGEDSNSYRMAVAAAASNLQREVSAGTMRPATITGAYQTCSRYFPPS